ncbi:MAG: hypothetical protein OK455_04400 [Thaumarchaeota archaeon]|nr:hypothetical protein [Nitrososphaerota archaeon]
MVASGFGPLQVTPGFLPAAITSPGNVVFAIILLLLSLALMFAGRSVIKGLAFLVAGLAGAAFGLTVGALFLGVIGAIIGGVLGFVVGGIIGTLLVHVGIGIALGYFGYLAASYLTHIFVLAVLFGVVLFVIGVAFSSKLLELMTATLGGVILYGVLAFFAVPPLYAAIISVLLAIAGFYVQREAHRRGGIGGTSRGRARPGSFMRAAYPPASSSRKWESKSQRPPAGLLPEGM